MKIVYVGADALVCGASFSMAKLIDEEKKLGIEVVPVVHTGNTEKILVEKGEKHYIVDSWSWMVGNDENPIKKILYGAIKSVLNIPCYFKYKRIIKKENPDIVHLNALTTYSAAHAAIKLNKPVVWHIREMMEEDLNGTFWNKKMAYTLMKKATQFIAISKCVENKYKAIVGHENIQCIYNGVDIETFYNKDHEILNDSNVVITMAGRITREKGQLLCLKELLPILKKNPNVILQFAGVGNENELNAIVELRNKEGISEEQVKFLGFVKEVNRLWSKTDIAIVYSKFEAFGRVTVEAKMAGALVVGFDSGGTSELIKNGVDGYLFDGNVCTLNQIVQMILSDKEKSKKVAREGRKSAAEIFTSENNAKQIWQLYKDILQV